MKNKKAFKISGIVATILGALCTAYFAYNWITIANGTWAPVDEKGIAIGTTPSMICTIIAAVVTVIGVLLWVKGSKKD